VLWGPHANHTHLLRQSRLPVEGIHIFDLSSVLLALLVFADFRLPNVESHVLPANVFGLWHDVAL
jgi:hypothetical protein